MNDTPDAQPLPSVEDVMDAAELYASSYTSYLGVVNHHSKEREREWVQRYKSDLRSMIERLTTEADAMRPVVENARALVENTEEGRAVLYNHMLRNWSEEEMRSFGEMLCLRNGGNRERDAMMAVVEAARACREFVVGSITPDMLADIDAKVDAVYAALDDYDRAAKGDEDGR